MNRGLIFTGFTEFYLSIERAGGAYRMAHYLRQFKWDIEVIDYITHWNLEDLKTLIDQRHRVGNLKWVGFSATWNLTHPNVKGLCDYIKDTYPEVVIIVGGHSVLGTDLRANYYVNGFGEYAGKAILEYEFSAGTKPYGVPHFKGWAINALHFYPSWPMDDYTVDYEARDFLSSTDVVSMELSRGCRFACKFCTFPILGVKEDTSISEELIYKFLNTMHDKWGVKTYMIADETLNDRNSKLEKLSSAVQRAGFEPNFNAFIRIDLLKSHPEQLELLAKGRVWSQFYGVETFNHRAGKVVGKGLDPEVVKQLMIDTKRYMTDNVGLYRGTASFIAGLPYETESDLDKTHQWLLDNWLEENWSMWVLGIPKPNDNSRLSVFGEDISKFGYSEMTQLEVDTELAKFENDSDRTVNPFESTPHIYWKNPQGNYFSFHQAARKFDGYDGEVQCREGNFNVWGKLSLGMDPKEAIMRTKADDNQIYFKVLKEKVNLYIQKKLSL